MMVTNGLQGRHEEGGEGTEVTGRRTGDDSAAAGQQGVEEESAGGEVER